MVHLEAVKLNMQPIPQRPAPRRERWLRLGLGLSGSILAVCTIYYGIVAIQAAFGETSPLVLAIAGLALYVGTIWYSARHPDLELDDPNAPILELPRAWDVTRTGLDFLIPIAVLLWCLMVEQISPGLSAFWATLTIIGIVATRKPLMAIFRKEHFVSSVRAAAWDLTDGLALGARNMIGIAVATATAGIVVGTITLTGLGLMMTELVEFISGGNVILMLILIAAISLVLGMGIPTTANYILVATLMAPVVVELGAQAGLAIPLIAVHLFVFYFGIMADITPPVGLAAFAAAAISKEDPIATGFQGALYSLRTAILPFVFIFNPAILLIGVETWAYTIWVAAISLAAILIFSAATMNWFVTKSRLWESAVLLLACFTLFRPDWWLNQISPPYKELPASEFLRTVEAAPAKGRINFVVQGFDLMGDEVRKTVNVPLGEPGEALQRLRSIGLTVTPAGDNLMISNVAFGSYAKRIGLEVGYDVVAVLQRAEQPSSAIPVGIGLALAAGIAGLQFARRRDRPGGSGQSTTAKGAHAEHRRGLSDRA
jgi:TRAP transporter 4TM/12TM fusion protein